MKFIDLARYFDRLEQTPSRNQMMAILSEVLKAASADEISFLVYLSLGGLAPKFKRIEFNIAEKMILRSIAKMLNKSLQEVTKDYKKSGDLGNVIETYISERVKPKTLKSTITVREIYDQLLLIAQAGGSGSQEIKVDRLAALVTSLDPISAKYILRIVLNKLRLGFSDKTILDALSFMESGTKSGREDLDWAYQVHPDVGHIASLVKEFGTKNAKSKVKVELGVPVMPALAQRLKTAQDMIDKMGTVMAEPKFDGTRVQIHFDKTQQPATSSQQTDQLFLDLNIKNKYWIKSFTRNLDESSHMFPELQQIVTQLKADSIILDSEAVGYDPKSGKMLPFQMTITRKRKHGIGEAITTVPLKFYVFDILYKNGKDLIKLPLNERRAILSETINSSDGPLVMDDYLVTSDPDKLRQYHHTQLKKGLEGAMVKKIDGPYTPGRLGWNWVKFKESEGSKAKLSDTLDCLVMGYYRGQGKRAAFGIGAFLVGIKSNDKYLTIAKIGTGLSDDQWHEIKSNLKNQNSKTKPKQYGEINKTLTPDVWVSPHLVVEVAADEITISPTHSAGLALRFPRLVRFRDDKDPSQTTSLSELKSIAN